MCVQSEDACCYRPRVGEEFRSGVGSAVPLRIGGLVALLLGAAVILSSEFELLPRSGVVTGVGGAFVALGTLLLMRSSARS